MMEAPSTPPHTTNPSQNDATPLSRGLAPQAQARVETNPDCRAGQPENIRRVEIELKDKQMVDIVYFLKVFIARVLCDKHGKGAEDSWIFEETEHIFKFMLDDAISFCNDMTRPSWIDFKANLTDYCNSHNEKGRYKPFSNMLNAIQAEFRDKDYSTLPRPSSSENKEEIVFLPNDPTVIRSEYLIKDTTDPNQKNSTPKRKPDVIGVFLSHLCEKYEEYKDLDFTNMVREVAEGTIPKHVNPKERSTEAIKETEWKDIHLVWELKRNSSIAVPSRDHWTEADALCGSDSQPSSNAQDVGGRVVDSQGKGAGSKSTTKTSSKKSRGRPKAKGAPGKGKGGKRKRGKDDGNNNGNDTPSKRSRTTTTTTNFGNSSDKLRSEPSPDVQCAYYGIERLSASFSATHSIVILLTDEIISLRWYDAQGCIQSHDFDFSQRLPLFVLMIMTFQRFTPRVLGLSQRDSKKVEVEGKTFYVEDVPQLFQLHGRRTFGSPASTEPVPAHTESEDAQTVAPQRTTRSKLRLIPEEGPATPASGQHDDIDLEAESVSGDNKANGMPMNPSHSSRKENRGYEGMKDNDDDALVDNKDGGEEDEGDEDDAGSNYVPNNNQRASPQRKKNRTWPFDTHPLFFKSLWAECTRDKEFDIIKMAYERAEALLEDYAPMVVNHIPKVEAAQACTGESTDFIRLLFRHYGIFAHLTKDDIKKQARVRNWQVCRRLKPITELAPDKFWKVFWDIIRCLYLLWQIGIAHGDVSLSNMMYYEHNGKPVGVLNDFDLAAIMAIGDRTPKKKGSERTGTIPFMAVDLLDFPNGEIGRRFRHDLESCTWCLAWEMVKVRPKAWFEGNLDSIRQFRLDLTRKLRPLLIKSEWKPYYKFMKHWLFKWDDHSRDIISLVNDLENSDAEMERRRQEDEKRADASFMRPDAAVAKTLEGVEPPEALEDLSWIDVNVGPGGATNETDNQLNHDVGGEA